MRTTLALAALLSLTAATRAEAPRLTLMDEGLAIQELRPLERHVWVLTLEGRWKTLPKSGVRHYVNVFFPNGAVASHHVLSEDFARLGEFRVLLQEKDLVRNKVPRGANLTIVI